MSTFTAIGSDLALRIRRTLNGSTRSLGTAWRTIAAMLLCVLVAATLPSAGTAQARDRDAAADRGSRGTASDFEELTLKIRAAIDAELYALAIIGVLASVVAAFYYLRIIKVMYFDAPVEPFQRPIGVEMAAILTLTGVVTLFFVVFAGPLVRSL